jgi:uncharacterized RDD family membrane protein YckC
MSDFAPTRESSTEYGAMPSALDHLFPPEKARVDAPATPIVPKHEFELEDRRYADWRRRRAAVIDSLILAGFFWLTKGAFTGYLGAVLLLIAFALTYYFLAEATTGQTIGKRMAGLRVVMRDGRPAPANAIAARTVLRLIDVLPVAWMIGGLVMLLTGGRRQRLGDLAARTVVRKDDREMARPPHSPLLGVYPILWIGMSLLVMWQANLFGLHAPVSGHRTSNPYMAEVDKICERRVSSEWALGLSETSVDASVLWARELGAIDSMPPPPPAARHDMRIVSGMVREILQYIGRNGSRMHETSDRGVKRVLALGFRKRYKTMQKKFRRLGLPYCAEGVHGIG